MNFGTRKKWRTWLRWLIPGLTLLLLALFARQVDWSRAWETISNADPFFIGVAVAAHISTVVVKGLRWGMFLDAAGVRGVGFAVRSTLAAAALNNVLVANGGDAARVAAVARRGNEPAASVLATLAIDKFCDLTAYVVIFLVASFVLPLPPQLAARRVPVAIGLVTIVVAVAVFVARNARSNGSDDAATDRLHGLRARLRGYWQRALDTWRTVASGPRLALAILLAFAAWTGEWTTFHSSAQAASFPITPATSLLAALVVNASFLIRLTPGNVGVFHLLYVLAATSAGHDRHAALGVAVLISLIQYIPVTLVGLALSPTLVTRGGRPQRAGVNATKS